MSDNKKIHIITGGTVSYIATHSALCTPSALCAPAYGKTGEALANLLIDKTKLDVEVHRTKMAGGPLDTNDDVERLVDQLVADPSTKIVFMPVALCDFDAVQSETIQRQGEPEPAGKGATRLKTSHGERVLTMRPSKKIIPKVRKNRKDIFLVGFKTTDGVPEDEQYIAGLNLLKSSSCNLVLANDVKTRVNMVITPEEARYHVTTDRGEALKGLVEMTLLRSHLTFTRSTVIAGEPVPWDSDIVPATLREVVDFCIAKNAYKPFRGATVGHFAAKLSQDTFITSQRKTNFNDLKKIGLVKIKTDGPDTVLAYGSKPSVGGQSQRIVFSEHPEYDCIVHFHCPLRYGPAWQDIPVVSQREYECGSHECGQNTSRGLKAFCDGQLSCIMLDQHGPNIAFNSRTKSAVINDFIDRNFDLSAKTGGYVDLAKR